MDVDSLLRRVEDLEERVKEIEYEREKEAIEEGEDTVVFQEIADDEFKYIEVAFDEESEYFVILTAGHVGNFAGSRLMEDRVTIALEPEEVQNLISRLSETLKKLKKGREKATK